MNVGIDPEGLFAIYADWIAFLREKRTTFEGQLAKLQGKDAPGKEVADQPLPPNSNGQATGAQLSTTDIPLSEPQLANSPKKAKKTKTPASAPVIVGTSLLEDAPPLPSSENAPPLDEKEEEIPEWLWQSEGVHPERLHLERGQIDPVETSSSLMEDEEEMDDWM